MLLTGFGPEWSEESELIGGLGVHGSDVAVHAALLDGLIGAVGEVAHERFLASVSHVVAPEVTRVSFQHLIAERAPVQPGSDGVLLQVHGLACIRRGGLAA